MGAVASALFTALALRRVPVPLWGQRLLRAIPRVQEHVAQAGRAVRAARCAYAFPV